MESPKPPTDLAAAITLIRSRAPLTLHGSTTVLEKETGKAQDFVFADDHEFVVSLPAWVFRALLPSKKS